MDRSTKLRLLGVLLCFLVGSLVGCGDDRGPLRAQGEPWVYGWTTDQVSWFTGPMSMDIDGNEIAGRLGPPDHRPDLAPTWDWQIVGHIDGETAQLGAIPGPASPSGVSSVWFDCDVAPDVAFTCRSPAPSADGITGQFVAARPLK